MSMSPRISQGCALVLLLAMMLAIGAGMIAWGPITLGPADHLFADQRPWLGVTSAFNVAACLPQFAFSLWGIVSVWQGRWPAALRPVWLAFFGLSAAMALFAFLYHLHPSDVGYALAHAFAATALSTLALAFLAERMHPLFGTLVGLGTVLSLSGFAAFWWFAGEWTSGQGDLRVLVFLEFLPLLLIPAGALSLPGEHTSTMDWMTALLLYFAARAAGWADAVIFEATGWLSGHTTMHLLLGAVVACMAYRASVAPAVEPATVDRASDSSQPITSLNTSS